MISPEFLLSSIRSCGVSFFTGVPDSLLKDFCACVHHQCSEDQHQIATSEGSAVALAMGHYLGTGNPSLVYMQNSGLGNALNPLISLASPDVYGIPIILMIGWRGEILEDGIQLSDEPQHSLQGKVTLELLNLTRIPFIELTSEMTNSEAGEACRKIARVSTDNSRPVAIVVRKGAFEGFGGAADNQAPLLSRESAIQTVIDGIPENSPVVVTTGMASRELYELRKAQHQVRSKDFLTVGGMGHAAQIAAGIARAKKHLLVVCIDGDGSFLMHTGTHAITSNCTNILHIVINNRAHDSVGGQPTPQERVSFCGVATALGYENVVRVSDLSSLAKSIPTFVRKTGSRFIEVVCGRGSRPDLGRPKEPPTDNKHKFMDFLLHE